ncbi:MAG: tryptophan synthase subunit alpha [Armatimonadetes bacterium]|nr:tryptophan synthase subunit alpha [Armatimonadota bacterium]
MTRIGKKFQELAGGERALVCFLTAGDPSLAASEELVLQVAAAGADLIELGVPFSDPIADGPSIQAASIRALERGTTLAGVLQLVRAVRRRSQVPLILMSYYNPILRYGLERFAADAAAAGVDGVIPSDVPPEEADEWLTHARRHGLDTIFLLAPTSTDERIARVAEKASGFVYCVSRTGVTGAQATLPDDLQALIGRIRARTSKPIAVGFGISTPEQVRQVTRWADGAVGGSALVIAIARAGGPAPEIESLVRSLKAATRAA